MPGTPGSAAAWAAQVCGRLARARVSRADRPDGRRAPSRPGLHCLSRLTDTSAAEPRGGGGGGGGCGPGDDLRPRGRRCSGRLTGASWEGAQYRASLPCDCGSCQPVPRTASGPSVCPSDTAVLRPPEGGACAPGALFSRPISPGAGTHAHAPAPAPAPGTGPPRRAPWTCRSSYRTRCESLPAAPGPGRPGVGCLRVGTGIKCPGAEGVEAERGCKPVLPLR